MAQVQTLRGPIETLALGTSLVHEHVLFQFDDSRRQASIDFAVKLLREAEEAGIRAIVDLTPMRRIDWLDEIARQVTMPIIASTGCYLERLTPPLLAGLTEEQMVERMVRELIEGIDGTPVRAGIIKVAGDLAELTDWEKQVFRAAARAQIHSGACIATHACLGAREQARVLQDAGADLGRVFFSHIESDWGWEGRSRQEQAAYLAEVSRMGGRLLFNNFGCEFYTRWTDLVYFLRYLGDAGYQDRLLMSIDCNWTWNNDGKIEFEAEAQHPEAGRRTFAYMMTDTVPQLLDAGFSDRDIRTFLVDNPRRFFEGK
jgi:phosphotriesterase-related protein